MTQHSDATSTDTPTSTSTPRQPPSRPRKELIMAGVFLGLGFLALPLGIYFVGVAVLGPYGGGPHVGSFLGDFYRNLWSGVLRTWLIALSPYVAFLLLRIIFFRWQKTGANELHAGAADEAQEPAKKERREPFVAQ